MLMKCMGKIIFICHRWRKSEKIPHSQNLEFTKRLCCYFANNTEDLPLSTALYFNQFLNDDDKKERQRGIDLGHELMKICDIVYSYEMNGVSEGMGQDKNYAKSIKKEVKVFKKYPWE